MQEIPCKVEVKIQLLLCNCKLETSLIKYRDIFSHIERMIHTIVLNSIHSQLVVILVFRIAENVKLRMDGLFLIELYSLTHCVLFILH